MAKNVSSDAGVASMRPDNMSQGLADDFNARIEQARVVPWDYDGKIDHHVLAARLVLRPDEDQEVQTNGTGDFEGCIVQHFSMGELDYFVPSMDGKTPSDLQSENQSDWEGVFALRVGKREQLNSGSNWGHFMRSAIEAGFDPDKIEADIRCVEGIHGHFNRVNQQKRSGIQVDANDDQNKRARQVLVLTKVFEDSGVKTAAKSSAKSTSPPASQATSQANGSGVQDALTEFLLEALANADGNSISKATLPGLVAKGYKGAEKGSAIKMSSDPKYLGDADRPWSFDATAGTIALG